MSKGIAEYRAGEGHYQAAADWLEGRREELLDRMHTRRDRDGFGQGYGNSSGYASKRSYLRGASWRPGIFKLS